MMDSSIWSAGQKKERQRNRLFSTSHHTKVAASLSSDGLNVPASTSTSVGIALATPLLWTSSTMVQISRLLPAFSATAVWSILRNTPVPLTSWRRMPSTACQHLTYSKDSLAGEKRRYFSFRQQTPLFWRKKNKFSPFCAYIARGVLNAKRLCVIWLGRMQNNKSEIQKVLKTSYYSTLS